MLHSIRPAILERMRYLEAMAAEECRASVSRTRGICRVFGKMRRHFSPRDSRAEPMQRLRQIPPETGRFLTIMAANADRYFEAVGRFSRSLTLPR